MNSSHCPTGSLLGDCEGVALPQRVAMTSNRNYVARESDVANVNQLFVK